MKKFVLILFSCILSLCLTSCMTEAYGQTVLYDDGVELVVRYGTPYYYGSTIAYYYYNGYYFYPYRYGNGWRFHRYSSPLYSSRPISRYRMERPHRHHDVGRYSGSNMNRHHHGGGHNVDRWRNGHNSRSRSGFGARR